MKKLVSCISLLALGVAAPAFAHDGKSPAQGWTNHFFHEADTNKDGYVDKSEYMAWSDKKFSEMDSNNDGKLSKGEVMAFKKKEHGMMEAHHGKHTGGINKPEDTSTTPTSEDAKTNSEH